MCRRGNRQTVSNIHSKKIKKIAASSGFAQCCVCNRHVPRYILESHVNECLDRSAGVKQSHNQDLESHLSRGKEAADCTQLAVALLNRVRNCPDDGAVVMEEHPRLASAYECDNINESSPACTESGSHTKEKHSLVLSIPKQIARSPGPESSAQVHEVASESSDRKAKVPSTHESQQWPLSSSSAAVEPSIRKDGEEVHQTGSMRSSLTGPLYKSGVAASLPPLKSPLNFLARESMQQPRIAACFRRECGRQSAVVGSTAALSRGVDSNEIAPQSNSGVAAADAARNSSVSETPASAALVLREGCVVLHDHRPTVMRD